MKKWIWSIVAAVMCVGIIGAIFYAKSTHTEAGFMQVCWRGGKAIYNSPDCGYEVRWPKSKIPLTYTIEFDKDHKVYVESVEEAAKSWNRELGMPVFARGTSHISDVIIKWGSISGDTGGHTRHEGTAEGGPLRAMVVLVDAADVRAVYRYAMHELGHVLGLAHDDFPRSVMYPIAPGMPEEHMKFILPSDHDIALLKDAYK